MPQVTFLPKLYAAGWTVDHSSEQRTFTEGRIVVAGSKVAWRPQKRADYLLRYSRDFTLAVVEAKAVYRNAADALQQAKEHAQMLGLKFAYATNGHGIIEHDFLTGRDTELEVFPLPATFGVACTTKKAYRRRSPPDCSPGTTTFQASRHVITKSLPSTGQYRPFFKRSGVRCSLSPRAPARPSSLFRWCMKSLPGADPLWTLVEAAPHAGRACD